MLTTVELSELEDLLLELEDRYDGAPDSGSRWMAPYIHLLKNITEREKPL